jgi:predicted HicB family RNase H-like nuclease
MSPKGVFMARKRLPDEEELSPLSIRIPVSLREQIEQSARRQRRSLNQEVILWLERAAQDFGTPEAQPPTATAP